jgi:large subunit ribosomal protein L15
MMEQHELKAPLGARAKKKRVGRGDGSGSGTYCGRGNKGQNSRAGGGVRPGFEGGQLPLIKRLPRVRGFTNIFKTEYHIVNVGDLARFDAGMEVNPEQLCNAGLIKSPQKPVKVLGNGEIDRPLTVKASKFSAAAEKKIVAAGGKVEGV